MVIQFIIALIATMCFAILYGCPPKEVVYSGLSGAVGWCVYIFLMQKMEIGNMMSCVIATFILALVARILAVIRRCPVTVYLLVSIFPLVPGAGIYYMSYYLITKQNDLFGVKGFAAFETAAAIAFGIALAFGFPQSWFKALQKKDQNGLRNCCKQKEEKWKF